MILPEWFSRLKIQRYYVRCPLKVSICLEIVSGKFMRKTKKMSNMWERRYSNSRWSKGSKLDEGNVTSCCIMRFIEYESFKHRYVLRISKIKANNPTFEIKLRFEFVCLLADLCGTEWISVKEEQRKIWNNLGTYVHTPQAPNPYIENSAASVNTSKLGNNSLAPVFLENFLLLGKKNNIFHEALLQERIPPQSPQFYKLR